MRNGSDRGICTPSLLRLQCLNKLIDAIADGGRQCSAPSAHGCWAGPCGAAAAHLSRQLAFRYACSCTSQAWHDGASNTLSPGGSKYHGPASATLVMLRAAAHAPGMHGEAGQAAADHKGPLDRQGHEQDAGSHGGAAGAAQHGGSMLHVPRDGGVPWGKPSWLATKDRHAGSMRLAREDGAAGGSMGGKHSRM